MIFYSRFPTYRLVVMLNLQISHVCLTPCIGDICRFPGWIARIMNNSHMNKRNMYFLFVILFIDMYNNVISFIRMNTSFIINLCTCIISLSANACIDIYSKSSYAHNPLLIFKQVHYRLALLLYCSIFIGVETTNSTSCLT